MAAETGFIPAVRKASDTVDRLVGWVCALIFGAMTLAVLIGVFYRYVLDLPLSWPEEVSRYLMIWGASLAISLGIKSDEHVGLTVLMDRLKSPAARTLLRAVSYLLVLVFQLIFFWYSLQMVKDAKYMQTLALGITMILPYAAMPVAMVLAVVQLIMVFILKTSGDDVGSTGEIKIIDI
ncbi:MAG: TRAP transporter small permease [Clostridia bacterium]|jgi:TRAP-type C4-dicarboxylate transport system permease small subunit